MKLMNTLEAVASETTCTMFSLNVTPSGQWKMYVFQSKLVFTGTLENVCKMALAEFTNNRKPLNPQELRHNKITALARFKYLGKPAARVPGAAVKASGNYNEKLAFAKAIGFPNLTKAVSELSAFTFNNQFKQYKTGTL